MRPHRVLLVDLNNFARFPTLSVGLLAALLRAAKHEVSVFSPLAVGVRGYPREGRDAWWSLADRKLRYWSAVTRFPAVRTARRWMGELARPGRGSQASRILHQLQRALEADYDVVLVSAYTMYFDLCREIGARCRQHGVPLVIGGPYLHRSEMLAAWTALPGVTAVVAGEPESLLVELVDAVVRGDALDIPGVATRDRPVVEPVPPLADLDALPFPDYRDFPWTAYPNRIVPMLSGRGCGWGRCTFCSDVVTAAGRTYRSRSPQNVLAELEFQSERLGTKLFVFSDLKLNSNLSVWRGLIEEAPRRVPGAAWTAAVHVDGEDQNGLTPVELRGARKAGLVRVSTGLESGSQSVLNRMRKGTRLERTAAFLHDASEAGISVRVTLVVGYPGETDADLEATASFLAKHRRAIDRVMLNRFSLQPGTPVHTEAAAGKLPLPGFAVGATDPRMAVVENDNPTLGDRGHRRAIRSVLREVHAINRQPLRGTALEFDGVM